MNGLYIGHIFYEGATSKIAKRKFAMFVGIAKAKGVTLKNVSVANSLVAYVESECQRNGYTYIMTSPLASMRNILLGFGFLSYISEVHDLFFKRLESLSVVKK